MIKKIIFHFLLISASIAMPVAVADDELELYNLTLEELLNVKVTIASRIEQTTNESPSSVTVYTRADIQRMGISSLEELLNYVPGVQTARTQHNGPSDSPIFRGRTGQNGGSPGILLMLDGRRLNDHVYGTAFGQRLNNLDWIKQVEIIRGPGSTLYGANAFNGVINLVSDIKDREIKVRVGEMGTKEASIQLSESYNHFDIELYFHKYQDNGQNYDAFYQFLGTFDDTQDPQERDSLALNLAYNNWYYKGYYSQTVADDFVSHSNLGNGINQAEDTIVNHRIGYDGLSGQNWEIDFYADYMQGVSDLFIRIIPADLASIIWWSDNSIVDAVGGNHLEWSYRQIGSSGQYKFNEQHTLTFGAEYRDEWVDVNPFHGNWLDQSMRTSEGSVILPCDCISRGFWLPGLRADLLLESDRDVLNAWLQDQWKINDSINATVGLRHDHYDDFGGHLSLRGALVYQYSDTTQFKMLYGEAFRAPSFTETRAFVSSSMVGNPNLQPETIRTVDIVWQQNFGLTNLVVTWSNSEIDDEIRLELLEDELQPGVFAFQPQNTGLSELQNWELEVNSSLTDEIMLRAGYTYHTKFVEQGVAQTLGFFALNYNHEALNINLNAFYHDEVLSREADAIAFMEDIYLDNFWRFNLSLNYSINDQLNLMLRSENLFDENYKTYDTANGGLELGIPTRGRIFSVGLDWTF